ncbi:MAG: lipopolysaccharide heptosyltransferase II [Nitrospira sp.]|nr:lipopolysaccharide heptosyltransferase II [Nitrospira sp.]
MHKALPRKILVRAPNWIGDAVMCEPALRGLRSLFPAAELTLLARPTIAELFTAYSGLDRVLIYDDKVTHAGIAGKWSLAGSLRRHSFELAVLFQNAFEAAFVAWLAGIPRRYGYATDGRVLFLTEPVAVPRRDMPVHQVEYYWNMLKPLGLSGEPPLPTLQVSPDEDRMADAKFAGAGIDSSDLIIGVNPGSTYGGAKRWLPERFADVARQLAERLEKEERAHVAVALLGAKGEESLGKDIASRVDCRSIVLSGATSIRELMAVVKRCRLLITNDTGPMHIAAAFGVPIVAVFGPTDSRTTAPYRQERSVVREAVDCAPCLLRECPIDHRCMTRVSVDRVYGTALKQLAGLSGRRSRSGLSGEDRLGQTDRTDKRDQIDILSGYTIFLDRDGTLNADPGYIKSPDQLELFPGVPEALARLKQAGARLILVTNQSGVARGLLSHDDLAAVHAKLNRILDGAGASLDAIYFCPHHPNDGCECRKPNPGMIDQAVRERRVDLERAYLIGDHVRDIELAKRIGARSVLVTTGVVRPQESEGLKETALTPDWIAPSMTAAADWLLCDAGRSPVQTSDGRVMHR